MRLLSLTVLCLVALATGSSQADAKSQKSLRVGNSWSFQFEGTPGTGYTWQVDAAASNGQDRVKLESLGYQSGRKTRPIVVGAPAPFLFRVTCLKPGDVNLAFAYVGPTGKLSPKRHELALRCN